MADTKVRESRAILMLKVDHRKIRELFASCELLESTDVAEMSRLVEEIRRELLLHTQVEEEHFYPAVTTAPDPRATGLIEEAREAHLSFRALLEELSNLSPTSWEFDDRLKVLRDTVIEHIEEEEIEIFPLFEDLDPGEQNRIADEIDARKRGQTDTE